MILRVKLFAVAKQLAGSDAVEVDLPQGSTVGQLRAAVAEQMPALAEVLGHVMIAVNMQYASDETVVPARAEVACIPPVSGG